ncbi:MAG: DUF1080 domain-containing protein [Balneolaceae bacterium]
MKSNYLNYFSALLLLLLVTLSGCSEGDKAKTTEKSEDNEWISIWDGETFENWRVSENPQSFSIEDGKIIVDGPRAHLFYEGHVADADFKNFEFKAEVFTYPKANSGIFFHTRYQEEGWPEQGYEAQVNATHSDPRKTGSLYAINDVMNDAPHQDEEWFRYHIIVNGQDITININDQTVMEFSEPEDREGTNRLSSGTVALQAHDPESRIYYRDIKVRLLDEQGGEKEYN